MVSLVRRLSLHQKLIALATATCAITIVFLVTYFSRSQLTDMNDVQTSRAVMYGNLLAIQVRSAVAFDDRETAREVLDSLAKDLDVTGTVLYGDSGTRLYTRGTPSEWTKRVAGGVDQMMLVHERDRISIVAPVISLEGPTGTLVVELSMAQIHANQRAVIVTALLIGLITLVAAIAATYLVARRIGLRVRAIAIAAASVARGDLDRAPVSDRGADEIGSLARAFNAMRSTLREHQTRLESRVAERTAELAHEMERRTKVELELRQAQKLEAVGRLASGIAHEINTPMQFVGDSVHFLRDATADLIAVLAEHRIAATAVVAGHPAVESAQRALAGEVERDIEFACSSIPDALTRAMEGIDRVVTIVRSMKEFAHPDSTEPAAANLNAAIESTLAVARNEYKYVADVVTKFGDLPTVCCRIGEINQVLLNLVINAAHAIGDIVDGTDARGTITVSTSAPDPGRVIIEVADTGGGIPETIRDRVFDPFFTTKEVGRGTGQGLAIARGVIVDRHRGAISFSTELGRGTIFRIVLPTESAQT